MPTFGAKWFDAEVWKHASKWEKWVAQKIMELSDHELSVEYAGFGAGISDRIEVERTEEEMAKAPFDLLVKKDGKELAEIEVAADRKYTWVLSTKIPTRADKVERAKNKEIRCYMVYVLTLETPPLVLWLPFEKVAEGRKKGNFVEDRTGTPIMIVSNYYVPREQWKKGLESLVQELQTKERKMKS